MWEARTANYHLLIGCEPEPLSPRNWDNLGTMTCWHRRYDLGDKHNYSDPEEFFDYLRETYGRDWSNKLLILSLSLLDHSGLHIYVGPPRDPWDNGQVGWIWATLDNLRRELPNNKGETAEEWRQRAIEYLTYEVETYDRYLRGEVYYFELNKTRLCEACGKMESESVETCGDIHTDGTLAHEYILDNYIGKFVDEDTLNQLKMNLHSV